MSAAVTFARDIPGIGRLEFEEFPKRRNYWLLPDGGQRRTRLPSVTSILRDTWPKPALLEWYAQHGREAHTLLERASERGKAVHRFVEVFMSTGELLPFGDFPDDFHGYLQGAARFLWELEPEPLAVELLVCHPELNYAGRLDLIANVNRLPTLLDFKSNPKGNVYTEAHVQAAAYVIANERCAGPAVDRVMIVGLSEDGRFQWTRGELDASRKTWASALDFYKTINRLKKALANGGA